MAMAGTRGVVNKGGSMPRLLNVTKFFLITIEEAAVLG
jgi:hypothetical protein